MRIQALSAALVVALTGSAIAFAATGGQARTRPDLLVKSISNPPSVVLAGGSFTVRDRTGNTGRATAPGSVTQYYLVGNGHRLPAGRRIVPRLRPARSSAGTATARVLVTAEPGTYSLVACADATGVVRESNERNNCRTAATTVVVKKPPPPA